MSIQIGSLIKEARTSAGLSQKALAEKVEGLSASTLGKAERGEAELTPEQLKAIAEATGIAPETLITGAPEAKPLTDEEVLGLFKAADPSMQQAAVSLLKGEQPQAPNPMAMIMKMLQNGDVMNKLKGFMSSDTGKSIMKGAKNIFGGENNNERYGRSMSVPLMAFTFFYTISHYVMLLSFYFWLWRKDIKPEK